MAWRSRTDRKATGVVSPHDFFSIVCACGETISGERTAKSQQVDCPECGEPHYVLPRDVYPRPQILPQPPPPPPPVPSVPADELPVDFDLLEGTDLEPVKPDLDDEVLTPPPVKPREKTAPPPRVWVDREGRGWMRRKIVILSSVAAALLAFTIWWGLHVQRMRAAEFDFREQIKVASDSVSEGNWLDARVAAEQAATAADLLGLEHDSARWVRQLHRSLEASQQLLVRSPVEIVLDKVNGPMDPDEWTTHFRIHYSGGWIVFAGDVIREVETVEGEKVTRLWLDDPLELGEEQVRIGWHVAPEWSQDWEFRDDRARVCVAAQCQEVVFPSVKNPKQWEIRLDDSVLWTDPALARQIGLVPDDPSAAQELLALLARQRKFLNIPEERP